MTVDRRNGSRPSDDSTGEGGRPAEVVMDNARRGEGGWTPLLVVMMAATGAVIGAVGSQA